MTQEKNTPMNVLNTMLKAPSVEEKFQKALGENKDAFIASIIDLYNGDTALQTCEPKAVICEALKAAVLKLPINKALGFSYIVVYNNSKKRVDANGIEVRDSTGRPIWDKVPTPTFVMGYKGYLQMAMRTAAYETINTDVVYEGQLVNHDLLSGEITLDASKKESDKVIGYFAYYKLLNGLRKTIYMSVEEMATYAKRYSPSVRRDTTVAQLMEKAQDTSAPSGKGVGWEGNFTDMALKTCLRRLLSKYGYLSIEMQKGLAYDIEGQPNDIAMENPNIPVNPTLKAFEDVEFKEVGAEEQATTPLPTQSESGPDF